MRTGAADGAGRHAGRPGRPYLRLVLLMPLLGSTLGIDGGAIFQIVAADELGLSPGAIGTAFGLGVLSVPLQLWAARMPLWRGRRNLQLFFAFGAAGTLVLALLVATAGDAGSPASAALVLTVCAEITLSVLYATAWQPLLAYGLPAAVRQRVNSRWRAGGGALLAAALLVFGAISTGWRVLFLGLVGGAAVAMGLAARRLAAPTRPEGPSTGGTPSRAGGRQLPGGILRLYLALGAGALSAWPLFLLYTREVLWPTASLGLVGASQLAGSLGAGLAWRSTSTGLVRRARAGAAVLVLASASLLPIAAPVEGVALQALVLVLFLTAAAATTTVLLALMELAHVAVHEDTSVRVLTVFDVVASTSLQAGLFAAGLVIDLTAATPRPTPWTDPYRLYLTLTSTTLLLLTLPLTHPNRRRRG